VFLSRLIIIAPKVSFDGFLDERNMMMNTRSLLISSGIAGATMAVLSNVPVVQIANCLVCMWLWAGGILGVWLYRYYEGAETPITSGEGAIIGVVSGVFGAILGTVIGALFGSVGFLNSIVSQSRTAEDLLGSLIVAGAFSILGLLISFVFYILFGAIGGAIGAALFGKPATSS
jgi:hypothetical protein